MDYTIEHQNILIDDKFLLSELPSQNVFRVSPSAIALINCIEVSEQFDTDGQRQQNITIKYNFVGKIPENQDEMGISA